ncbi:MAG TPA: cupin-like domain-containing protein [Polyangiaceae bacterium]|jgi:hypothetical protein|nr:cupin-like domain-containing protein [Polyangiaceae bacterium]
MAQANQIPVAAAQATAKGPFQISVNESTFDTERITRVTHSLDEHPLLDLDEVRKLARRLDQGRVRWHRADIPVSTNFANAAKEHANGRTLEHTLEHIDEAGSWVFLQHIEKDAAYGAMVREVLGRVAPTIERRDPGMRDLHGWIFVSSPRAITPYHMDHEANFLLQVRGRKTINVWNPKDRSVVGEKELETFHGSWSLDDTAWRDEFQAKANVFDATPGTGVFMPFTAPHTVQNGNEVSVTLSLTFITKRTEREAALFSANRSLRKLGLSPRPVGSAPLLEEAKFRAFNAWTSARDLARSRGKSSRGM